MSKEKRKIDSVSQHEIDDAIADIEAFIQGRYKSMYLMGSWILIRELVLEIAKDKEKKEKKG